MDWQLLDMRQEHSIIELSGGSATHIQICECHRRRLTDIFTQSLHSPFAFQGVIINLKYSTAACTEMQGRE